MCYGYIAKDIRQEDCAQVGVETLWWSFYLVWKPSSQEVPGPSCVLSAPSPKQWDAIGYQVYQTSSYCLQRDQTSLLFYSLYCVGPGKILFVNLLSSTFSCTVFLYNVFGTSQGLVLFHGPQREICSMQAAKAEVIIHTFTARNLVQI
jgi:hypothetical protein